MDEIVFVWDERKNLTNINKHGVSFEEAKTVFTDEFARLIADPDRSAEEERFILLGISIHSRLLVVCHCVREENIIRIFSARKAGKTERNIYEGYRNA
ncbi:MAG: BrnT family toxin [Thiotrichales bacterium]|nr:BrnT family toxin [Thiotrichales bacterium]